MKKLIYEKINLLNQTALQLMTDEDNISIIKNFTDQGIRLLNADFGFSWGKFNNSKISKIVYKSPQTPWNPYISPKKMATRLAKHGTSSLFDSNVKKENYKSNISRYLKSYIIIPIRYGDHIYGGIALCYKKQHNFTKEEFSIAETIRSYISYIVTINWLLEKEQKDLDIAEKQKEIEILLAEEKQKTEFMANATHEIRTPLAIMRGNIDLVLENKNIHKVRSVEQPLKAIRSEIRDLSEILSNLSVLTSNKTGYQKNMIQFKEVDVISLIKNIIERVRVLLNKKHITVKINTGQFKKLIIAGDYAYLEKLFINLIRNAIIYGNVGGKILIEIQKDNKKIIVTVTDNGIGISKEDLPHIFERFYRSEQAWRTTKIGTGLGLALAKWTVDIHGGDISASSVLGKGSVFKVTLPINHNIVT